MFSSVSAGKIFGALAFVYAASAARAFAQRVPEHILTGVVVAAADQSPLPHAMVTIEPLDRGRETFTDDRGRFSFPRVSPGTYRLRVIHLGFKPSEQSLTVSADSEVTRVHVELDQVQVRLATIAVTAEGPCLAPGAPDTAKEPEFAKVFQQLEQNALQYRLLIDSFPYAYRIARTEYTVRRDSTLKDRHVDTLQYRSDARRWN